MRGVGSLGLASLVLCLLLVAGVPAAAHLSFMDSGPISPGGTYSVVADEPIEVPYGSRSNVDLRALLVVTQGGQAGPVDLAIRDGRYGTWDGRDGTTFTPADRVEVQEGAKVVWKNIGRTPESVTAVSVLEGEQGGAPGGVEAEAPTAGVVVSLLAVGLGLGLCRWGRRGPPPSTW